MNREVWIDSLFGYSVWAGNFLIGLFYKLVLVFNVFGSNNLIVFIKLKYNPIQQTDESISVSPEQVQRFCQIEIQSSSHFTLLSALLSIMFVLFIEFVISITVHTPG